MRPALLLIVAILPSCHRSHPAAGPTLEMGLKASDRTSGEMEGAAMALERACSGVAHVAHLHSVSSDGEARITVELEAGANVDVALSDVQQRVLGARALLPDDAGPVVVVRGGRTVVGRYVWSSEVLPLAEVDDLREAAWIRPLSQTPGIGPVASCGGGARRITVDVDSAALAGAGLTVADVAAAISAVKNGDSPSLSPLVLAYSNGAAVRLSDVATVFDDWSARSCRVYDERGRPVVEDTVRAVDGADLANVGKSIAAHMPIALSALPQGVDVRLLQVGREITVELDPGLAPAAFPKLSEAVANAPGAGAFLVEIGSVDDPYPSATTARVLLDTRDEARVKSVTAALAQLPFVRSSGEPNATVELTGPDRAAVKTAAEELVRVLSQRGELVSRLGMAERLGPVPHVDGAKAATLGLSLRDVTLAIGIQRGRVVATVATPDGGSAPVFLRVRSPPGEMYVRSAKGLVPLSAVTSWSAERTPSTLLRGDQAPMVGVRVRTADPAGLQRALVPPAGMSLRVVPD